LHAHLFTSRRVEYIHATDKEALDAAYRLIRTEGIIPALETAHALAALDKMSFSDDKHIVLCLSGRGDKDLNTYIKYYNHEQDTTTV
jgi:tryptophan synthase beta chain